MKTTVSIDKEVSDRLKEIADTDGSTINEVIKHLLERYSDSSK